MAKTAEQKLYKKVSNPKLWENGTRFLGVDSDRVLWFDPEEKQFCVNTFTVINGEVEFSPMPIETYK